MIFEAIAVSVLVMLLSVVGVVFFAHDKRLVGIERYAVPVAAGVFLSLVLMELIPETLAAEPKWGGLIIMLGFVGFYILSHQLHARFHQHTETGDCHRKEAAALLLVGDGIHNFTDGVVLGSAFLIDPAAGVAVAIGLALHEIPQEIVEFGVLVRAGYTRKRAVLLNLASASMIIPGTLLVLLLSEVLAQFVWVLVALAAGNLLYLAASDLLPRIHDNLPDYGNIWHATFSIVTGFVLMTLVLWWAHGEMHYHNELNEHHEAHSGHDDHDDHEEDGLHDGHGFH